MITPASTNVALDPLAAEVEKVQAEEKTASTEPTPAPQGEARTWKAGTLVYTSGGLVALFGLLLFGDFAWSMRDRSVAPAAQWYLNSLGVSNFVFGLLLTSFPAFIGLILGPIISVKSDRHRGKWGRRIPFLLVTTPLAAVGMIGLGVTPILAEWLHSTGLAENKMAVSILCFGVFWALFEIATIAAQAVFGGLINDVVPPQLLGRFYGLFRAISLLDGMIFNFWIMGYVPTHFTLILVSIGTFYGIAFTWVCLKVKEGDYPPPALAEESGQVQSPLRGSPHGVTTYLRECFTSPYYLSVFLMIAAAGLVFLPVNTFALPYAKSLGIEMELYGKYLALTYSISLGLAFFLGWLADRFHPLRMAIATMTCYFLVAVAGALFATTPNSFLVLWVLHGVLSGAYMTSAASLALRLFPRDRFAQFASAAGILTALAHMVLAPALGTLIDQTGNIYRYTFVGGSFFAAVALVAALAVHSGFMKLGGPTNYVAPAS